MQRYEIYKKSRKRKHSSVKGYVYTQRKPPRRVKNNKQVAYSSLSEAISKLDEKLYSKIIPEIADKWARNLIHRRKKASLEDFNCQLNHLMRVLEENISESGGYYNLTELLDRKKLNSVSIDSTNVIPFYQHSYSYMVDLLLDMTYLLANYDSINRGLYNKPYPVLSDTQEAFSKFKETIDEEMTVLSETTPKKFGSFFRSKSRYLYFQLLLKLQLDFNSTVKLRGFDYIKKYSELGAPYPATSANFSHENLYYFEETDLAKKLGESFLNDLFDDIKTKNLLLKDLDLKNGKSKRINTSPRCISFIPLSCKNKLHCLVALSGFNPLKQLTDHIAKFCENYEFMLKINDPSTDLLSTPTKPKKVSLKFDFIKQARHSFYDFLLYNFLESKPNQNHNPSKRCSEKSLLPELIKLFSTYGKNLKVLGAANFQLLPKGQKFTHKNPGFSYIDNLSNVEAFVRIPCCKECQVNKFSYMEILHRASKFGTKLQQELVKHPNEEDVSLYKENGYFISPHQSSFFSPESVSRIRLMHRHRQIEMYQGKAISFS